MLKCKLFDSRRGLIPAKLVLTSHWETKTTPNWLKKGMEYNEIGLTPVKVLGILWIPGLVLCQNEHL